MLCPPLPIVNNPSSPMRSVGSFGFTTIPSTREQVLRRLDCQFVRFHHMLSWEDLFWSRLSTHIAERIPTPSIFPCLVPGYCGLFVCPEWRSRRELSFQQSITRKVSKTRVDRVIPCKEYFTLDSSSSHWRAAAGHNPNIRLLLKTS